jgi:hypothetical protein
MINQKMNQPYHENGNLELTAETSGFRTRALKLARDCVTVVITRPDVYKEQQIRNRNEDIVRFHNNSDSGSLKSFRL